MPITINLRHLEKGLVRLEGETAVEELDLGEIDELIGIKGPLRQELEAERIGKNVLVQGSLELDLECQCVRCLKKFPQQLRIGEWTLNLPLEGEDKVRVDNDCVDLTPFIREDILLAFPQHPLCDVKCSGLPYASDLGSSNEQDVLGGSSAWAVLNKLKL